MLRIQFLSVLFLSLFFSSCNESDSVDSSDPANLVVDLINSEDGSGQIDITVTAENVIEFYFDSGETGIDPVSNTTGIFTHTYTETGVYVIEIRAIGATGRYLKHERPLTILIGDDTGLIDGEKGPTSPLSYDGMTLIWQDEFSGSNVDLTKWNFETGTGSSGWGNNELQYYRENNTAVYDGFLVIEAKREAFSNSAYTSSRLTTQNKFNFQYGRIDIRAQMPEGQGIWPALWMLGKNITTVGWPACGEIDIMEMIGGGDGRDNVTHGTIHWDQNGTKADFGGSRKLLVGNLSDSFHVYSLEWTASSIKWFIDDIQYHGADISPEALSEFRNEFFLIMNIAVGGNWPGSPNTSSKFPQKMAVDYIRVFQPN